MRSRLSSFPFRRWEWNSDGSLAGRVYGKKGYKEGEAMNTSIVPEETRYATYVVTGSGSIYRLGEPLLKIPKEAKARRHAERVDRLRLREHPLHPHHILACLATSLLLCRLKAALCVHRSLPVFGRAISGPLEL